MTPNDRFLSVKYKAVNLEIINDKLSEVLKKFY